MAVLGVMYAGLLVFVIVVVWQGFEDTQMTAEHESNSLTTIYRLTAGLSEPDGARLRELSRAYARTMIDKEWPAIARGQTNPHTFDVADQFRAVVTQHQTASDDERLIQSSAWTT